MSEANLNTEFQGKVDGVIEFEKPKNVRPVSLPELQSVEGYRGIRANMHVDMLSALVNGLGQIKRETLDKMYIQGRVLTEDEWGKLKNSPVFIFYINNRTSMQHDFKLQREVDVIILPSNYKGSDDQIRTLAQRKFTVETLSDRDQTSSEAGKIDFRVGWYRASDIMDMWKSRNLLAHDGLEAILGGVNEFSIGSNDLNMKRLWLTQEIIDQSFREYLGRPTVGPNKVKQSALAAAARIVNL